MKAIIIEDDFVFSQQLHQYIYQFLSQYISDFSIDIINNNFQDIHNLELYDLIFIDIQLNGINGIHIIEKLREKSMLPIVVFVSSHDEFVFNTFKLHALSFVRKQNLEEDIHTLYSLLSFKINDIIKSVSFIYKGRETIIKQNDILYLESHSHDITIVTQDNDYTFRSTFDKIINKLGIDDFGRIQKSIYVSLKHVKEINNDLVVLDDQSTFTVSKIYKNKFYESYKRYLLWN